jgi:hypothetical protein
VIKIIKLLLPILQPSWQFFKEIAPSPRIEFRLLEHIEENLSWIEFRPRPEKLSILSHFYRFFYNAEWNETMYMTNCAESLIVEPTEHADTEIKNRIKRYLLKEGYKLENKFFEFRITFIYRRQSALEAHVLYQSSLDHLSGDPVYEF